MRRWIGTAALAAALGAGTAMPAAGGGGERFPDPEPNFDRFLFLAVLEGLFEDAIPADAVEAVLEKDAKGRFRNFVYACPVCHPVIEGFRAYSMRSQYYYGRKGDPYLPRAGVFEAGQARPVADLAARLAAPEPGTRGGALHDFVERCVARRMERLRLREEEREEWRLRLLEGRKQGMGQLRESEGFQYDSCPSCDGAAGQAWK